MKTAKLFILIVSVIILVGCAPLSTAEQGTIKPTEPPSQASETPTSTPDPCTGWVCTIEGTVYAGEAKPGNELVGVMVKLDQFSYCSPTKGEQEVVTGEDGGFAFEVFLHDTDGFKFEAVFDGYMLGKARFGGFDCLYCACQPVEIVLMPAE